MSVIRHGKLGFVVAEKLKDGVLSFDQKDFGSTYQNFSEIIDYTLPSAWYQGLIYVDYLMGLQDWSRLKMFVHESDLRSNILFLQGICLRLEQIAATQPSEEVRYGAIRFLKGLRAKSHEVQEVAQDALGRLDICDWIFHRPSGHTPSFASGRIYNNFFLESQDVLPPVWDPLWHAAPTNILLRMLQEREGEHLRVDAFMKIDNQPKPPNLGDTLQTYYDKYLVIKRLSGKPMDLQDCYINLAIVKAPGQRKRDKEGLKFNFHRMRSYEEIPRTNMKASIPLDELFVKRGLSDGREGVPKKILVQGRAGIGKTTLCIKLVHAYQSGLWKNSFDAVLWLPLRQLKAFKARNLEDLLREKYFAQHDEQEREMLVSTLAARIRDGKVLFILDGLDEIVTDTQKLKGIALKEFLDDLLKQEHIIITSRPSGVDKSILPKLDLELETIGFSPQNVKDYVANILDPEVARAIQDYIQRTPLIQDLVNIPVQLDVVCCSWDLIRLNKRPLNMTRLYQIMVLKLWCKDGVRLQKSASGETLTEQQLNNMRPYQIENLMADESEFIGYLAFKGIRNNHQIEFNESALQDAMEDIDKHLLAMTLKETTEFIQQQKYNPRNEIIWWMVAGQLEGETLKLFFSLLKDEPRDLIGGRHQQLLAGCFKEARTQLDNEDVMSSEAELMRWLQFEMSLSEDRCGGSILGSHNLFPEELLVNCLGQTNSVQEYALRALTNRSHLTSAAVEGLILSLKHGDQKFKASAISTLSASTVLEESAYTALIGGLQDGDEDDNHKGVRILAAEALVSQTSWPESAFQIFVSILQDTDSDAKKSAAEALRTQSN
ncbi:hypothetical protein BGX26_008759 [Mortierella sp. AD094]|nr:hypothetical protein BGX26_008759 [Mortierella sp. AD094]